MMKTATTASVGKTIVLICFWVSAKSFLLCFFSLLDSLGLFCLLRMLLTGFDWPFYWNLQLTTILFDKWEKELTRPNDIWHLWTADVSVLEVMLWHLNLTSYVARSTDGKRGRCCWCTCTTTWSYVTFWR